jgi:hypothetical protein
LFCGLDLRTTEPPMLYESLNGRPMVPILARGRGTPAGGRFIVEQVERIAPMIAHLGRVPSQLTSEPLQSVDVTDIEDVAPIRRRRSSLNSEKSFRPSLRLTAASAVDSLAKSDRGIPLFEIC